MNRKTPFVASACSSGYSVSSASPSSLIQPLFGPGLRSLSRPAISR